LNSSYLRTAGEEVALEFNARKPVVFVVLFVLEEILRIGSDSALPFVVYRVIKNRLRYIRRDPDGYKRLHSAHIVIASLLSILGFVEGVLGLYLGILNEFYPNEVIHSFNGVIWYRNIDLTYAAIYFAATLEMFTCAVFIVNKSRQANIQSRVSNSETKREAATRI
jgi:hypothetical protein